MRLTIAPASTKTAVATIQSLLRQNDTALEIHAIYRDTEKAPATFTSRSNFHAVQGDVSEAASLGFGGSDAVLAITPPAYDGRDILKHAETVSKNVKDAIEKSGTVKRLVLLSSGGAQFSKGVGEIETNNLAERVLAATNVPELTFVRCAFFMENWTVSLESLRGPEPPFFWSTITPLDWKVPMVAIRDIGSTLATELVKQQAPPSRPFVFELHGPQPYTPRDVQAAFCTAMGKHVEIRPVERHQLHAFYSKVFPPQIVEHWVEMTLSFLPGGILAPDATDYDNKSIVYGKTDLQEAIGAAAIEGGLASPRVMT